MKEQEKQCYLRKTSIGGQALMEGIMMRGPKRSAMAVRNPKGEIVVEEFETKGAKRPAICRWPIIRGVFGYIDSMVVGYRCLMRSAEIAGLDDIVEENPKKKGKKPNSKTLTPAEAQAETTDVTEQPAEAVALDDAPASFVVESAPEASEMPSADAKKAEEEEKKLPSWVVNLTMILSVVLGVGLAVGIFVMLPTLLFELLAKAFPVLKNTGNIALNSFCKSGIEGVTRIILLVAYMSAIALMKDIRRTFMFHGAEHKTIFCYEAGLPLTVENVKAQRRFHPRCGTSFLILMLIVSIFISFFIDPISIWISGNVLPVGWRYLVKLLLIPLIVGIGYELIKFAGRHDNWFTRLISTPGVWLQHLTVFEPTDDMIECAIVAVKEVIPDDESDQW